MCLGKTLRLTEALPVFEPLIIQSHQGEYCAEFQSDDWSLVASAATADAHCLVDARVAKLYPTQLAPVLQRPTTILIDATEEAKSYEGAGRVIVRLVGNGIRRQHKLVAIGGGIIQDITCFISSTLLRGIPWEFFPTTLLSQADSCIGSKSSINLGEVKNILGTFNPPRRVVILTAFLQTLDRRDICSGIGEMLKVHAIAGPDAFDDIARHYDALLEDSSVLLEFVRKSLLIKKRYIEEDEFDRGIRNIFNYGHSFGHAIEAATQHSIPHGIAVTMGMDIANFVATRRALISQDHFGRMHPVLEGNFAEFRRTPIPLEKLLGALSKDKKNTVDELGLILPVGEHAAIERVFLTPDASFRADMQSYLNEVLCE
jgi:3-dehydroquinate synthase